MSRVRDHHRWNVADRGVEDYWSTCEFDAHVSPTANMHDAVTAVEKALSETEALLGHLLVDDAPINPETGMVETHSHVNGVIHPACVHSLV